MPETQQLHAMILLELCDGINHCPLKVILRFGQKKKKVILCLAIDLHGDKAVQSGVLSWWRNSCPELGQFAARFVQML